MSDAYNIEPLSRVIPAKPVIQKDSSKDRQNHDKKKSKKKSFPDTIEHIEEDFYEASSEQDIDEVKPAKPAKPAKPTSSEEKSQVPPHIDEFV